MCLGCANTCREVTIPNKAQATGSDTTRKIRVAADKSYASHKSLAQVRKSKKVQNTKTWKEGTVRGELRIRAIS